MVGTRLGGLKARDTFYKKFGKDYYANMGRKGGKASFADKGFAKNPKLAKEAGARAGKRSKKGYKYIKDDNGYRYYISDQDGYTYRFRIDDNDCVCGERELVNCNE